jgi:hypothetical protein
MRITRKRGLISSRCTWITVFRSREGAVRFWLDRCVGVVSIQARCHANFELLPTCRATLIVLDKRNWKKERVLHVLVADTNESKRIRISLEEAVEFVLQMQRENETEDQKARRLAPALYRVYPGLPPSRKKLSSGLVLFSKQKIISRALQETSI